MINISLILGCLSHRVKLISSITINSLVCQSKPYTPSKSASSINDKYFYNDFLFG